MRHRHWWKSVTALALPAAMVIPALPSKAADDSKALNVYKDTEPKYKVKDLQKETETNHGKPRIIMKMNGDENSGGWKFHCGNGNSVLLPDSGVTNPGYNDSG